jgi:hypothetical protein
VQQGERRQRSKVREGASGGPKMWLIMREWAGRVAKVFHPLFCQSALILDIKIL